MIARFVLTVLLLGVVLYSWNEYRRAPVVGFLAMIASLIGTYFVWSPAQATVLAEYVGVGRGADLVIYLWVVISLIIFLNLHLKLRAQMEVITVLARELAFANARFCHAEMLNSHQSATDTLEV